MNVRNLTLVILGLVVAALVFATAAGIGRHEVVEAPHAPLADPVADVLTPAPTHTPAPPIETVPVIIPVVPPPLPPFPRAAPVIPERVHSLIERAQKRHKVTERVHSIETVHTPVAVLRTRIDCAKIRGYVKTFGIATVEAEARRRGFSETMIKAARTCLK